MEKTHYKYGRLSNDRFKCLDDIGFVWDPDEFSWKKMFVALKEYKKKHGDCNVPLEWSENKQLATWVNNQRTNYRKEKLSKDHIKRLKNVGFVWEQQESSWEKMFAALKEYKKKHGDCNVPLEWSDKQLVNWVRTQRTKYRKGQLNEDQIKCLDDIGFVWNIHKCKRH